MSAKAYFLQGAIEACEFPQLQVHSFGLTAGAEAAVEAHRYLMSEQTERPCWWTVLAYLCVSMSQSDPASYA